MADRVLASLTGLSAEVLAGHWWAMVKVGTSAVAVARRPALGECTLGYGVCGTVAVVPDRQPLAADGIWRVTLAGEGFGRMVRQDEQDYANGAAGWQLLQLDDLTDAQLQAYETAMSAAGEAG